MARGPGLGEAGVTDWRRLEQSLRGELSKHSEGILACAQDLLNAAVEELHCEESSLLVPDEDATHLQFLLNSNPETLAIVREQLVPCERSLAGYAFHTCQPVAIGNIEDEQPSLFWDEIDRTTSRRTRVYLAVPLPGSDQPLGVQTFVNRTEERPDKPFSQDEIALAEQFAAQSVVLLQCYQRCLAEEQIALAEMRRLAADVGADVDPFDEHSDLDAPATAWMVDLLSRPASEQQLLGDMLKLWTDHLRERSAPRFLD